MYHLVQNSNKFCHVEEYLFYEKIRKSPWKLLTFCVILLNVKNRNYKKIYITIILLAISMHLIYFLHYVNEFFIFIFTLKAQNS